VQERGEAPRCVVDIFALNQHVSDPVWIGRAKLGARLGSKRLLADPSLKWIIDIPWTAAKPLPNGPHFSCQSDGYTHIAAVPTRFPDKQN